MSSKIKKKVKSPQLSRSSSSNKNKKKIEKNELVNMAEFGVKNPKKKLIASTDDGFELVKKKHKKLDLKVLQHELKLLSMRNN